MSILTEKIHEHVIGLPTNLQMELLDYILYLEKKVATHVPNNRKVDFAMALDKAAELNPFSEIVDPVIWQHEQRQDRLLPEREE